MDQHWLWVGFNAFVLAMLTLDLGVFHRRAHEVSVKEAATWSAVWVSLALGFNYGIYHFRGEQAGLEFLAGYLIEKALSVDNIFVFVLIFSYFRVPPKYQHRVLFWGILGALVMRGVMIGLGAYLIHHFEWVLYVFGAFLVWTGYRMARQDERAIEPEANPVIRLVRRLVPVTGSYRGPSFFIREPTESEGATRRLATPLFVVLVLVETTDLIFAVDSIPAVFAVTRDPFLVYSSNVFAILGLRALYFLLGGIIGKFRHLKFGLSIVLIFVGAKMLLADVYKVPIGLSLGIIALLIAASIIVSLIAPAPEESPPPSGANKRSETAVKRRRTDREDQHGGIVMKNRDTWQQQEGWGPMDELGTNTIHRRVEVANPLGLTMRAAAGFVVLARQYQAEILVFDGAKKLSGKSLVDLATLVAPCGTRLDVEARGPDARQAVAALAGLVASRPHGTDEK